MARQGATGQNPDVIRAEEELSALQGQLAKLQHGKDPVNGDVMVPTGKVPSAGLEYVRRYRDVKYYETIYEVMAKQFEIAKIDEAKNAAVIQQMDKAVPPEKKSGPRRLLMTLMAFLTAGLLAILGAFLQEGYERLQAHPEHWAGFLKLRQQLWSKL